MTRDDSGHERQPERAASLAVAERIRSAVKAVLKEILDEERARRIITPVRTIQQLRVPGVFEDARAVGACF